MFQNLSEETIEILFDVFPIAVMFIGVFVYAIVIAVKDAKQQRKSEKQKQLNQTDEK